MKSRKWWLNLHRLVGLYSVMFVFILTLTGLVLSFSDVLQLEKRSVFSSNKSLSVGGSSIRLQADQLVVNDVNTKARCVAPIAGVIDLSDKLDSDEYQSLQGLPSMMVACQNVLYWMSLEGDIFDSMNIPKDMRPIQTGVYQNNTLFIASSDNSYAWNLNQSALIKHPSFKKNNENLPRLEDSDATNMAQFILNLHTGLIAGDVGKNLMRLASLGLLFLCVSGLKNALRRN